MSSKRADGWSEDFKERLTEVIALLGGVSASARLVDYSHDQIANWRDGRAKMPLIAARIMCAEANRSVDWLCSGVPSGLGTGISDDLVRQAADIVIRASREFPDLSSAEIAQAIALRARNLQTIRDQDQSGSTPDDGCDSGAVCC